MGKSKKKLYQQKKSLSRLIAIQLFYQFEFYDRQIPISDLKKTLVQNYLLEQSEELSDYNDRVDNDLLEALLTSVQDTSALDIKIFQFLKSGWTISKLPNLMLYVLRVASFELKFITSTPLKVVIDEYVDIAACFFDSKKITFINSILESLAKDLRKEEFDKIKEKKLQQDNEVEQDE